MAVYIYGAVLIILFLLKYLHSSSAEERVCEKYKIPPANTTEEIISEWDSRDSALFNYISSIVPQALAHTGSSAFDSHLQGVQLILRHWGAPEYISDAGLFHSIYGTEGFQGFKLPLSYRPKVRELIGLQAERLVWIFCMVDRFTFDQTLFQDLSNVTEGGRIELLARPELGRFPIPLEGEEEWLDFMELTLADWLEQVEGAAEKESSLFHWKVGEAWSYRRKAYAKMAEILGEKRQLFIAGDMLRDIYQREAKETRHLHQEVTPPMSKAAEEARDALLYANS